MDTQPKYTQLKLPFPLKVYNLLEITELIIRKNEVVERGILRLYSDFKSGLIKASDFNDSTLFSNS